MDADELRERKADELMADLKRAREALFKARFAKAANQLKNASEVRIKRREIARILTVLGEKGEK
jgi:large subunit ribosomal protein L29